MNDKSVCVVRVAFCESQGSTDKTYDYFVPDWLGTAGANLQPGSYVVTIGANSRKCLCEVKEVLSLAQPSGATKGIIGIADLSPFMRRSEDIKRRSELISKLEAMEYRRLERQRFEELAGADADAKVLLDELNALDTKSDK